MAENQPANRRVVANLQYGGAYREQLEDAQQTGRCIFCGPDFQQDPQKVLYRIGGWFVRSNDYPTKDIDGENPEYHFLIISERHLTTEVEELSDDDVLAVARLTRWLKNQYNIRGGGSCERFGDPLWSGLTIVHAHVHVIMPRVEFEAWPEEHLDKISRGFVRMINSCKRQIRTVREWLGFPGVGNMSARYVNFPIG